MWLLPRFCFLLKHTRLAPLSGAARSGSRAFAFGGRRTSPLESFSTDAAGSVSRAEELGGGSFRLIRRASLRAFAGGVRCGVSRSFWAARAGLRVGRTPSIGEAFGARPEQPQRG